MTVHRLSINFSLLLSLLPVLSFSQPASPPLEALDRYIEQARRQWEAPGLAVAVVKDGEVLLAKGYGVRHAERSEPVDERTLFAMASTTKAVTAAALGLLVDEGKVDWDDRVVEHLPAFRLGDPYVTRELRVRDLLTHNAGLGNADFLWVHHDLSSDEILARMAYAEPAYSFRGGYTYQNIMYLAAGALIEAVSGEAWADFVERRLFRPLGMERTFPLGQTGRAQNNRATPHDEVNGELVPITDTDADAIGPAGSAWSCVADMARWMNFLLDSARVDGRRLLSVENFSALFEPRVIIPQEQFYPTVRLTRPRWTTYALGWFQHDYRGRAVSFHTGSLAGTVAICGLIPAERLGVYVFGNRDHAELRHAIMYKVFDVFGGESAGTDWSSRLKELYDGLEAESEKRTEERLAARAEGTRPTLPPQAYTGAYADPFYGELRVELQDGRLRLHLTPAWQGALSHWHYDTFQLTYPDKPWYDPDLVTFQLDSDGAVSRLVIGNRAWQKETKAE